RKFAMDVRELNVDWIDSINPFNNAYSIMSKAMNESSLKAMAEVIAAKKHNISLDEARDLAKRALQFKQERGRLPDLKSSDPWEQRMAQGIAVLARLKAEQSNG
ncbi:pseudomurein-binding repeat-containing protein, partial [Phaeodactylibacter sp.]